MKIDLTMTAARRPQLLRTTLASFQEHLFDCLPVQTFFLNIDPIWGTEAEADEVEQIARSYFANVVVRRPEIPSFGAAVKWLWAQPQERWFLHLEDDWILARQLNLNRIKREAELPEVVQIRLHNWTRFQRRRKPANLTTSPSLTRSDFGRVAADAMNPNLDPEKQFRNGTNLMLEAASANCRAIYHGGIFAAQIVHDIGREWRDAKGISKLIVEGASVWSTSPVHSETDRSC